MRALLIPIVLAACEPTLHQKQSLPELVRAQPLTSIRVPAVMMLPGETMTWNVIAKGFTIGRAELVVDDREIRSRFETSKLVSTFARVRHELVTVIDRGSARSASEVVEIDGETSRSQVQFVGSRYSTADRVGTVPDGNLGHTLHSALGVIRAWVHPDAHAGFLYVVHDGDVFRIDVARPIVEDLRGTKALRIDCRLRGDVQVSVTIWLRASDDRMPLRLEVGGDDVHLTAELLETET
ncbi:MAG: DUF3108 domain-containing protein [Deltaproteobacteria bacterium]|nr:DUF3108 domain-containing protein [Deltaproteobacteria bacterium]